MMIDTEIAGLPPQSPRRARSIERSLDFVGSPLQSPREAYSIERSLDFIQRRPEHCFFSSPILRPSSASDGGSLSPPHFMKASTLGDEPTLESMVLPTFARFTRNPSNAESRSKMCSMHPGVAAEYCCITCHGKFECSFCAASCSRCKHEMFSFFEAMEELPQRLLELDTMMAKRTSELMEFVESCKRLNQHFSDLVGGFRDHSKGSFKMVRAAVDENEVAMRKEVDCCSREVTNILKYRHASSEKIAMLMREYHKSLEQSPVVSLNVMAQLRKTLSAHSQHPESLKSAPSISGLSLQIRHGFVARRAGLDSFERTITNASRAASPDRSVSYLSRAESGRMVRPSEQHSQLEWFENANNDKPLRLKPPTPGVLVTGFEDLDYELNILGHKGHSLPFQEAKQTITAPEKPTVAALIGHEEAKQTITAPKKPTLAALTTAKTLAHNKKATSTTSYSKKAAQRAAAQNASKIDLSDAFGDSKKDDEDSNSSLPLTPPPEKVDEQELANEERRSRQGRVVNEFDAKQMMKLAENKFEVGDLVKVNTEIKYDKKKPLELDMEGKIVKVNKAGDVYVNFTELGSKVWVLKEDVSKLSQVFFQKC